MRKLALLGVLLSGLAANAAAQTVGTPVFMAPYRAFTKSEISGTFSDPGAATNLAADRIHAVRPMSRPEHGASERVEWLYARTRP